MKTSYKDDPYLKIQPSIEERYIIPKYGDTILKVLKITFQ